MAAGKISDHNIELVVDYGEILEMVLYKESASVQSKWRRFREGDNSENEWWFFDLAYHFVED